MAGNDQPKQPRERARRVTKPTAEEFDRFAELTRRLVQVPKDELDEERRKARTEPED